MERNQMKRDFEDHRPKGFSNKENRFLIPLIDEIEELITDTHYRSVPEASVVFKKSERSDLSTDQLSISKAIVGRELR